MWLCEFIVTNIKIRVLQFLQTELKVYKWNFILMLENVSVLVKICNNGLLYQYIAGNMPYFRLCVCLDFFIFLLQTSFSSSEKSICIYVKLDLMLWNYGMTGVWNKSEHMPQTMDEQNIWMLLWYTKDFVCLWPDFLFCLKASFPAIHGTDIHVGFLVRFVLL